MSDTPRTDAVLDAICAEIIPMTTEEAVGAHAVKRLGRHAQELERELDAAKRTIKSTFAKDVQIMSLKRQVEVLRFYGNKDCTAMADAALEAEMIGAEPCAECGYSAGHDEECINR